MDNETPKPMKKAHRNIFHKVGRQLEKFEQSFGVPSPNGSRGSIPSLNELPHGYYRKSSEDHEEDEDTVSLQYYPDHNSKTPTAILRQKHDARVGRPNSSAGLSDGLSHFQWQQDVEDQAALFAKDPSTKYDKEMKIICSELMEHKSVKLHDCRDYDKKVSLLRVAVSFNTPIVTGPVILYLENTLSRAIFYEVIKQHPSAIKNYINLAKLRLDSNSYISMLKQFNKYEDVAMIRLQQASQISDINNKIALLDQAAIELQSHYWWHLQVAEYRHLLDKQRELQTSLSSSQSNIRLANRTVLETYKTVYDIDFQRKKQTRNADKSIIERSKEIETGFRMSPEMIMCGKLAVIMKCGLRLHYDDFIHQAIHQSIFGKKYIIAPENLADMVYNWVKLSGEGQENASEKAARFLTMIQNPERRIYYAEKFGNYDVAMDTIANVLRDRVQLENFRQRIPHDHPSFTRATSLLENTKWRK